VDEARALYEQARVVWNGLELGRYERGIVMAALIGFFFYAAVLAAERVAKARTDNYRSRVFVHDMAFWFYYRSGLNYLLIIALLYTPLDGPLAALRVEALDRLPLAVKSLIFLFVSDCYAYWMHRAMHRFRFLWVFHTTHHAPERITFASSAHFHPVEVAVQYAGIYLLVRIFGGDPLAWVPVYLFMEVALNLQHTQLPWTYGRFGRFLVSPVFHSYHHSIDPAHYDRNFGAVFSIWDHLFGTALRDGEPRPARLGLVDVKQPSLWSALVTPFQLLLAAYPVDEEKRAPGTP
jgi:sterol desaturase/sphingolipid hydroxylase (fatty acid hydroxylase superfamily)